MIYGLLVDSFIDDYLKIKIFVVDHNHQNEKNIKPVYDQRSFPEEIRMNQLKNVVSGDVKRCIIHSSKCRD